MQDLSAVFGNIVYVATFGCALVGFLVIWKRVADVRAAGAERRAIIAKHSQMASTHLPTSSNPFKIPKPRYEIGGIGPKQPNSKL